MTEGQESDEHTRSVTQHRPTVPVSEVDSRIGEKLRIFAIVTLGHDPENEEPWVRELLKFMKDFQDAQERRSKRLAAIISSLGAALITGAVSLFALPWLKLWFPKILPP